MLLFCCFGDGKKQKKKKKIQNNILQGNEDPTSPSTCLLPPPDDPAKTVLSATLRSSKEKHPPSKQEKRLLKQKSQDSIHTRDVIQHQDTLKRQNNVLADKTNIKSEQSKDESLPKPPPTPKTEYGRLSSSKVLGLSNTNPFEAVPSSENSFIPSSSLSVNHSQSSTVTTKTFQEEVVLNGMKRSNAFHDAELLKEQISNNEVSQEMEQDLYIKELRANFELILKTLRDKNQLALEKAKESYNLKLKHEIHEQNKENEEVISKIKQEANDTTSKLNQQIILERGKLILEQQEKAKHLEEVLMMKSHRLDDAWGEMEERDQAWQDEKADVAKEVQRLKAEATRMVKILAMEYEEDNLSENKKISLSQEVYSLQLVVDMRTGEGRNLREQLARVRQKLEHSEIIKEKLRKATARMEDLEEQLKIKTELERQLSVEKSEMEMTVTNSKKAALRMSQNVEELQWRIKNNFDAPVEVFPSLSKQSQTSLIILPNVKSLPNSPVTQVKEVTNVITPSHFQRRDSQSRKRSFFSVSVEMLEATSTEKVIRDKYIEEGTSIDFSPSSDGVTDYSIEESPVEEEAIFTNHSDDEGIDGDSLDEGLGDISSESETAESPVPNNDNQHIFNNYNNNNNNNIVDEAIINKAKSPAKNNLENEVPLSNTIIRPELDRMPSRISFETPI